ncbi:copper resistance protein CopC (plasmid) [Citricoccus sp. SGAir0253]|nr:copper resistance protein CopC [Citricoccus sp. SGAir0253]
MTRTDPADGQSFGSAPTAVEVSFSDAPLALGAEILVEDAQGVDWTTGEVQIDQNNAVQPLRPDAPAGQYTVTWRVVSSDSHPIEGSFGFTVAGAGASPTGSALSTPASSAPATPAPTQAASTSQASAEQPDQGFPAGFIVVLVAILVLALVIVVVAVLARRRADATDRR